MQDKRNTPPGILLALLLIVLLGAVRFFLVMDGYQSGRSGPIALIFVAMIALSLFLLRGQHRKQAGFVRPKSPWWLIAALFDGALLALLIGWLGSWLYGSEISNWYAYIRNAYPLQPGMDADAFRILFLVSAGTSMIFSPLGEEFFYRGLVHHALRNRLSEGFSTLIDSAAFALTHICHFGLVFHLGSWELLPVPAAIWVGLMFIAAVLFSIYRNLSGSIWAAVVCHAGFNLGMTYYIFYLL